MTWIAVAVVGSNLVSGWMQSDAIGDASEQQGQSSAEAIAENRRQYDTTRGDFAPYRAAGTQALGQLQTEMGQMPSAAEVMSDPGYQFGLQQGQLGLDRKAAAGGGRVSGAALKSASQYATNYAAGGYNAAYQRRQDRLNRLAAIAGIGQSATGSSAAAGAQSTGAISNLISSQGNANAAATIGQGNVWGNAVNQIGAAGQRWAQQQIPTSQANWQGFGGSTSDPWYG